jgi:hypothetical protein
MKKLLTFCSIFALSLILWSCGSNSQPEEITGMTKYEDAVVKFSLKYPANWITQSIPGARFLVYSSKGVKDRFMQYDSKGKVGAKIEVYVTKLDSGRTLDTFMITSKLFQKNYYSKPVKVKLDGVDGYKQTYSFDLDDGKMDGEIYYGTKDGKYATLLSFEAFSGTLEGYRKYINDIVSSFKLAHEPEEIKPETVKVEAPPPSDVLITKGGDGYSISIPDNFKSETGKAKDAMSSRNYIGERRADCNIQVDVLDATKQQNLKKIVDENSPKYGNAKPSGTTMGGQPAYEMSYSSGRNVQSKVYFVIKGKKLYRITMNWFKGEEGSYLPVFDKCIKSIKFQ